MLAERKVVTKIEANPLLTAREKERSLVRVAAYCRVSTDSDEQLDSYQAQITYYTDYIAKNPDWRFAGIYADEGITGTKAEKRPEFQRLMRDCKKRKIDMILTKSVARFARNTVDSLSYVRRLKAQGIGVFFEEQNLDSMKADSEMFIGIHSVLAQAESENISANVRWGIQQRMKSGTFKFRYNILGYRKGADGEPEIEPEGAETVRLIYDKYLAGESLDQIRASLIENGAKAFNGTVSWNKESIRHILTNERFCGDMLLQKTYIDNCISRKTKVNHGEMPKYLITNNHVPSISYLDIDFRAFSENDYLFYCIAYDLGNGTSHTDIEDLSNDEVVDFDLFRMVCSAIAISVYGYDAIRVSERFRKHKRRKSRKGGWKHGE